MTNRSNLVRQKIPRWMQVLNLLGQPVAGFAFENASTLNETLDLDKQPAGLYLVQLTVDGQVTMRKLLRR